ncbi:MAG: uracil-DNA glycosylase family protein [Porphyromonadaceae bacterium]|nr:uracil-DNA glycosylase family protein [Porphyromonadaceae bacterium]
MAVERHPWPPFLPEKARLLMLGSFPPKRERWSMDFFYPNWLNDMWRIMGLIFYEDKAYFTEPVEKRFHRERIERFLRERGIALYDMAVAVRRLKDNASDQFLEVVEATDWRALLRQMPCCTAVVTTGQKATETFCLSAGIAAPRIGECTPFDFEGRKVRFYRMPSSSRAYPLPLPRKADAYATLFTREGIKG